MALTLSLVVLLVVLVVVARPPRNWPEFAIAAPGAAGLVALDLIGPGEALRTLERVAPTLAFLAAIFVIADIADRAGLFDAAGAIVDGWTARTGLPRLVPLAGAAVVITAALSLDATAVLFTPVVIRLAQRRARPSGPPLLLTTQLANGSSSLLPVSNLTNLLVVPATGLTFAGFAARMALPTAAAVAAIIGPALLVDRARTHATPPPVRGAAIDAIATAAGLDRFGRAVAAFVGLLVAGFFVASLAGIEPVWVAAVGALGLGAVAVGGRRARSAQLVRATAPGFLLFVASLAVIVDAGASNGLGRWIATPLPGGSGLVALLVVAGGAALLANLVNNVPATLVLLAALPHAAAPTLLAALVGVNVGPNLSYTGSLATLLWRREVRRAGMEPPPREFFGMAWLTTPLALAAAVLALWLSVHLLG